MSQQARSLPLVPLAALLLALSALACGGSPQEASGTASSAATASGSSASSGQGSSAGPLTCAPPQAALDACSGKAAGDACALARPDDHDADDQAADGGTAAATVAGTCVATVDGKASACIPTPPGPPAAAVTACSGKAAGDACTLTDPRGDSHTGACSTGPTGTGTLACARPPPAPPQAAIDACTGKAAGDACTVTDPRGTAHSSTCSKGPSGSGTLACAPPAPPAPDLTTPCTGLADGKACTVQFGPHAETGACTTPAAGGSAICVLACRGPGGGRGGPEHH